MDAQNAGKNGRTWYRPKRVAPIRLYAFNQAEVRQLRQLVRSLVAGDLQSAALQSEAWAEPVGGCCLSLKLGNRDRGIREISPCILNAN